MTGGPADRRTGGRGRSDRLDVWPAETGRLVVGALREAGRRYRRPPPDSPGLEALGEREVPEFWLENTTFG